MRSFRQAFEDGRFVLLALSISCLFIYLPSLFGYFLHTDDWFWTYWGGFTCKGVVNWILPIGRPLAGLMYCLFPVVHDFGSVWIFRLVNVMNIVVVGFMLWRWMVRWKVDAFAAFLLAMLVVTLPAFHVFASYISTMPHCFGLTASFAAALFVDQSLAEGIGARRWRLRSLAALFLVIAFCLNQASALFYVGVLAVPLLMSDASTFLKVWPRKLLVYGTVIVSTMGLYYVVFRASAVLFNFRNVGKYDGRNFVSNYGDRLRWFFDNPFYESSNLWSVNPNRQAFWGVLIAMVALVVWDYFSSVVKKGVLTKYLAVSFLFPAGYAVSLISSDPSKEYRTYAVLGTCFVLFLFLGLYSIWIREFKGSGRNRIYIVLFLTALVASLAANKTVSEYFVFSDSTEFRFVKNEIRKYLAQGKELKQIHVVVAEGPIAAKRQRNEIGEPTMRHTPNIEPLIWAALGELGIFTRPKVTTGPLVECCWTELIFDHNTIDLRQDIYPPATDGVLKVDISSLRFQ